MISVIEIGLSWEQELIWLTFGLGMTLALFQTPGTIPDIREVLNILVTMGTNISAYIFQNQQGRSSGPHAVRFCFRRKSYTLSNDTQGLSVSLGIDSM